MAYDSETYGQSPFGHPQKQNSTSKKAGDTLSRSDGRPDSGPDSRPDESPSLADRFPTIPAGKPAANKPTAKAPQTPRTPASRSPSTSIDTAKTTAKTTEKSPGNKRKSRSTSGKSSSKTTARKGKKSKAAEAQAQADAAEQAIAQRFREEDINAYLSLLYKTAISALVWTVLRLLRHELTQEELVIVNTILDPLVVSAVAFAAAIGLTFWLRRLLNDFARHTQKLHTDAEMPDSKNYRPTLEIVGDALEYNPKLRKHFAALFDAASILLCSLVSYLIVGAAFSP